MLRVSWSRKTHLWSSQARKSKCMQTKNFAHESFARQKKAALCIAVLNSKLSLILCDTLSKYFVSQKFSFFMCTYVLWKPFESKQSDVLVVKFCKGSSCCDVNTEPLRYFVREIVSKTANSCHSYGRCVAYVWFGVATIPINTGRKINTRSTPAICFLLLDCIGAHFSRRIIPLFGESSQLISSLIKEAAMWSHDQKEQDGFISRYNSTLRGRGKNMYAVHINRLCLSYALSAKSALFYVY